VRAFVLIKVGPGELGSWMKVVAEKIQKISGIVQVHEVFGRYDIIVQLEANSLEEHSRVVSDKLRHVPGVMSTETLVASS